MHLGIGYEMIVVEYEDVVSSYMGDLLKRPGQVKRRSAWGEGLIDNPASTA